MNWFIQKYGFLSSKEHLNKICTNDAKSLDKLSFEKFKNKNFYSEPLSLWVLSQVRLRSLIRLWRFVKATKDNINQNSYSFLLFDDTKKLKLFDIENDRYVETVLNKNLYSQIFDKNFKNELNFSLSPKIDVEKYLKTKGISENISSLTMNQKLFIFSGLFIEKQINTFFYDNDYAPKQLFNFNLGNELIDRKSYNYTQYNSLLQLIYFQLMDAIIKNKSFSRSV